MTVAQLQKALSLERLTEGDPDRQVTGGYCGDLLSWVMGCAREGDAWMTVMGNVNAVAVAVLADTACIILTEDSPLDPEAKAKAEAQGVAILRSGENAYHLAVALGKLLDHSDSSPSDS